MTDRLAGLLQDIRYALRGLRKSPGFTIAVVLTLGLGIGSNATMFGIVDRLMMRPPAWLERPDEVHRFYYARTIDGAERITSNTSYRRYRDLQASTTSFSRLAATFTTDLAVGEGEEAREMPVQLNTASVWPLFGAAPALGRWYTDDEDRAASGGATVAVLGHAFWRARYGERPDVIGEQLRIGGRRYTIIGVAPRGFSGISQRAPVAYIPLTAGAVELGGDPGELENSYGFNWMELLGRRRPGVSAAAAAADLDRAFRQSYADQRLQQTRIGPPELVKPRGIAASVLRERGPRRSDSARVATWLIGVSAVVLLIACANVGNLLLARAVGRRREIAVRLALGVRRGRLLRQLLTEALVLALLGGVAGLAFAQWGGGLLRAALLPEVSWDTTLADPRVLGYALLAALAAGILTGLAPAFHAGRADLTGALKAGAREGTYRRSRLRSGLLLLQGALSVVLLVGAGLFVRSLQQVRAVRLGYDAGEVLFVNPEMRGTEIPPAEAAALRGRLVERARALPGVTHAARNVTVPYWIQWDWDLFVPGIDSVGRLGRFQLQAVGPGYFETIGTRIVRGRPIGPEDTRGAALAIVVSERMARLLWPGRDAMGQCVRVGADTMPCATVVGIAEDIRTGAFDAEPEPFYYLSLPQFRDHLGGLYVRVRGDPAAHAEEVRRALQAVMPGAAYVTVTPLDEVLGRERRSWELGATMFTVFGALALLVAAVGLYSVIAYGVAQRTHELGVRVALGAQLRDVVRLVLGEGLRLAVVAVAIGLGGALLAGRFIAPLLFATSPRDPAVLGFVTATLLVIAALASLAPALRAARVDPNTALRSE